MSSPPIPKNPSLSERQLMLYAAAIQSRRDALAGRAAELAREVDWGILCRRLRARKLLTVLGPRLQPLARDPSFDLAVAAELEAARRQSALLDLIRRQTGGALAEAGIASAPLKGPALSEKVYGDPGRRRSSDIDLLVPAARLHEAVAVVRELGYAPPLDHIESDGMPHLHFALAHERAELPPIELHWRIHWYEGAFAGDRLLPADPGDLDWQPDAPADLAALLLYYARDGFVDLQLASDVGAWWDRFGAELRPGCFDDLLADYPALERVLTASARVAEDVVGLPSGRLFDGSPPGGLRTRIARRSSNPNPSGSHPQIYADRGFVDGLLCPPGGLMPFLRRQVFPPADVLEEHARMAGRTHVRSAVGRGLGILGRYLVTFTRLLQPREKLKGAAAAEAADDDEGPGAPRAVRVMGVPMASLTERGASRRLVAAAREGRGTWTVTANLDHLRRYRSEPVARLLIDSADLVVADGTPLVWASRLAGAGLPQRVAGSNMIWELAREAAESGVSLYLLGGDPGVADKAARVLCERHPGLQVAGTYCPPFGFEHDERELERIERSVAAAAPGLVLVGLGFPKQDLLIGRLRGNLPAASFVGVGISFSFVAGEVSRAPLWTQRLGIEWLHRLAQEPRRLARRYLVDGLPFALSLFRSALGHRLSPRRDGAWGEAPPQTNLNGNGRKIHGPRSFI
jgi:N-acetylglucosaminyldiphosphoundecaprenol N-acetyl-beta-D-mannosaminyltransferase